MDPEEQDLLGDYRYRNYSSAIEKALRNFESSSEWADLISSLGKLNKRGEELKQELHISTFTVSSSFLLSQEPSKCFSQKGKYEIIGVRGWALTSDLGLDEHTELLDTSLLQDVISDVSVIHNKCLQIFIPGEIGLLVPEALQSNLKYSLLPRRLIISKRLSQCLHPALPSGVHLKALETYEIIFKIIGTKWLAKDLFLYSSGLFPLLANAAMSVRPVLLGLYEKYFLPLQKSLLPGLQAFLIGLLPGLEEGSEIYDRTDALLVKLSLLMGQEVFYGALWGSFLVSPSIRLPASLFVVTHIDRELSGKQQKFMLGTDHKLTIKSLCVSVLDSNVLVQRNTLEAILFFFPFYTALVVGDLFLEVLRAFYSYCKDALGSDLKLSYNQSGNTLASAIKENKNASEIVKTVNLLITSLSTDFLWDYMTRCFEDCFRNKSSEMRYPLENVSTPPTITELCTLLVFLLDVIPLELYSEVQTQYLPQMLSYMVQSLLENMELLSLPELTHALKTCFKVLSKVQMPPSYLDIETGSGDGSPVPKEDVDIPLEPKPALQEEEEAPFQPLKSEDSGIGLSASSPELSQHLGLPTVTLERDDVWKKGGSIQKTLFCIQELVAKFSSKYIFGVQLHEPSNEGVAAATTNPGGKERKENGYRFPESGSKKKSPWDAKQITVPQVKQMLSELFSARGSPFRNKSSDPLLPAHDSGNKKEKEEEEWDLEQVMLVLGPLKGDCKEAFSAACHLLLDCTTFPVYLSEEEMEQLYLSLFEAPGKRRFLSWAT
ncbi:hypothetical protein BTVI_19872 [Pitangus sulphuratus]|nr:hypothetical protein BTVI_19872 [Pitangus sulphuratus]